MMHPQVYEAARSEVDRQLMQPNRPKQAAAAGGAAAASGGKPWQGFVDNKQESPMAKAIEEDLSINASSSSSSNNKKGASPTRNSPLRKESSPTRPDVRQVEQRPKATHPGAKQAGDLLAAAVTQPAPKVAAASPRQQQQQHSSSRPAAASPRPGVALPAMTSSMPVRQSMQPRAQSARPRGGGSGRDPMSVMGHSMPPQQRGKSKGVPATPKDNGGMENSMLHTYCPVSAAERLHRTTPAATIATFKTMARCRSGRLFEQTSPNSGIFSSTTPTVAHIEATSLAAKREDLQYRVLEYRAQQVYRTCSASAAAHSGAPQDSLLASAASIRPASAPLLQSVSASLSLLGGTMQPGGSSLPPRPFSAMPTSRGATSIPRPTSAVSQCSNGVVRPHSARLCSATGERSLRMRPPSAGAWAGRPVHAVVKEEEDGDCEVVLAEGWDKGTGDPCALMQVTAFGSLLPV